MPRIAFTFDEQSFEILKQVTAVSGNKTHGETVAESLHMLHRLSLLAQTGFSELVARNPRDGSERHLDDLAMNSRTVKDQ
jgi:hypothetical protein